MRVDDGPKGPAAGLNEAHPEPVLVPPARPDPGDPRSPRPEPPRPGLVWFIARPLALAFILFELLAAVAVVVFLMGPMALGSAERLAGLMVLSAQTWSELPPGTRPDFELELARTHWLSLRENGPASAQEGWHGFYVYFLERALAAQTGIRQHLAHEVRNGEDWWWATIPSGAGSLAVGFPAWRIGTHPLRALTLTLGGGLLLALVATFWLARRIAAPLAQLEIATAVVGRGEIPENLPETGPRELATLAARFNLMAHQVRELLAMRTTLMAGFSHDLRTPLARMRLALALLAERPTPRLIERLEQDIAEMDQLIGKILDLARGLEAEKPVDLDLGALLRELAETAPAGRVHCDLPALPLVRPLPPLALRRVIENLLENALRYGKEQPVDLVLLAADDQVRIGVLDRGPGIPPAQVEAMFQPFQRGEISRSPLTGGAGLGLAIVRQLTEANGWHVQLLAREQGGLAAWLQLDARPLSPASSVNRP